MPDAFLENIAHETVLRLKGQAAVLPGEAASKTLARNGAVSPTAFPEKIDTFQRVLPFRRRRTDKTPLLSIFNGTAITLFAFNKGEEIGTHDSEGDAMATVLEGAGRFTVDGRPYAVRAGETLVMPAKRPHAVFAPEPFQMLLTAVFPTENEAAV